MENKKTTGAPTSSNFMPVKKPVKKQPARAPSLRPIPGDHLSTSRRQHRRGRQGGRAHPADGAWHLQLRLCSPTSAASAGAISLKVFSIRAGFLGRRRYERAQTGVPDGPALDHRRQGPGQPLRKRHRGARAQCALLPGLFRDPGQTGRKDGGRRRFSGIAAAATRQRLRPDRRRDSGDAGHVRFGANTIWPGSLSARWSGSA